MSRLYVNLRRTCSQALREAFIKEFDPKSRFFDFAFYLLTTEFRDPYSGYPVLPRDVLRQFTTDAEERRTIGLFLKRFKEEYMPGFEWTKGSHRMGSASEGMPVFSEEIRRELMNDYMCLARGLDRVNVKTGKVYGGKQRSKQLMEDLEVDVEYVMPSTESGVLIEYMNNRPAYLFNRLLDNVPTAVEIASGLENEVSRRRNLEALTRIWEQPKPVYKPSEAGNTDRVFAKGLNITTLEGSVRRAMTKGLWEFDLAHSQLAIAAKLWDIPEVNEFIESGENIWSYLGAMEDKKKLKESLYGLLFGMAEANLKDFAPMGFMKKPLIELLLNKRKKIYQKIYEEGFVETCTGRRIEVEGDWKKNNVSSLMAQQAQAVELTILMPVIELAKKNCEEFGVRKAKRKTEDGFHIVVWQHDGFTATIESEEQLELLVALVAKQARLMGIKTRLVSRQL